MADSDDPSPRQRNAAPRPLLTAVDRILDSRPVRSSTPFRWLWISTTTSAFGGQIALVAVLLQVWELTGSPAWVGAMGLARAVPMIGCGLIGGALADRYDRRRLVMWATVGSVVASALLAVQAMASVDSLRLVLGLVAAQAASGGLGAPARRTFVPRLLAREQVAAGIALTHVSFQAAMVAGPALGGLIAAGWGVATCYLVSIVTAGIAWYGVARVPSMPPTGETAEPQIQSIVAGFWLVARRPVLRGSFLTDLAATLLAMPVALFPVVNEARFGGDPRTLGLFLSVIAVGGVAAGLTSTCMECSRTGATPVPSCLRWRPTTIQDSTRCRSPRRFEPSPGCLPQRSSRTSSPPTRSRHCVSASSHGRRKWRPAARSSVPIERFDLGSRRRGQVWWVRNRRQRSDPRE